jgi:hypothetical protein
VEECGPCPNFASFTLAFALKLKKKHGRTSVRVRKTSVRVKNLSQSSKTSVIQKAKRKEQGMKKGYEGRRETKPRMNNAQ